MTPIRIQGIPTDRFEAYRSGAPDAQGRPAEVQRAEGLANPCRHCLGLIEEGSDKLVLAYRPFESLQPYSECGPIFLHADACERYDELRVPPMFRFYDLTMVRGYGRDDRILYETGAIVEGTRLDEACRDLLSRPEVDYVHVRSKWGCFQCRVDRATDAGASSSGRSRRKHEAQ